MLWWLLERISLHELQGSTIYQFVNVVGALFPGLDGLLVHRI